jgi:hypothetical protein
MDRRKFIEISGAAAGAAMLSNVTPSINEGNVSSVSEAGKTSITW